MKVVVVGQGAREHAIAHALSSSAEVVVTPGNPGIAGISPEGFTRTSVLTPPEALEADLFVIGPEVPLVEGLADRLRAKGALVFGPGADGARLEGSKAFMKELAEAAGVPTARFAIFDELEAAKQHLRASSPPYVIKTDGLAAGKGVLVTDDLSAAEADLAAKLSGQSFGDAGRRVVLEEGLSGDELSLLVLTDGQRCVALPAAQDFKRLADFDSGPNTGGMGAYSPVPVAGDTVVGEVMATIVEPTLAELRRRGINYRGVLYAGCMLTADGPKLIEFNVRFGDPEAEVVLSRLTGDLAALLAEVAGGQLLSEPVVRPDAAVCAVVAAQGYPEAPRVGEVISGVEEAGTVEGVTVFHAGTRRRGDGALVTAGGRVLVVSALGETLDVARRRVYEATGHLSFSGMHYRSDIAYAASALALEEGLT